MRSLRFIQVVAAAACIAAAAAPAAVGTSSAWTVKKAERTFERDGRFALPANVRAEVAVDLEQRVASFRALQIWAGEEGDEDAWWLYHGYANRYQAALDSVENGLRVAEAACGGIGRSDSRGRFARFSCLVRSEGLVVPSTKLSSSDGSMLPSVTEDEPRLFGPYLSPVEIRVRSGSSFAYE
jgi:hypothetical protein